MATMVSSSNLTGWAKRLANYLLQRLTKNSLQPLGIVDYLLDRAKVAKPPHGELAGVRSSRVGGFAPDLETVMAAHSSAKEITSSKSFFDKDANDSRA